MSVQTVATSLRVDWDDGVVMVFSFDAAGGRVFCGFIHMTLALQLAVGSQTQVTQVLQQLQQQAVQWTSDPATWVETVKTGARGATVTVTYDDSTNQNYTTQTGQIFQLQQLFSLAG